MDDNVVGYVLLAIALGILAYAIWGFVDINQSSDVPRAVQSSTNLQQQASPLNSLRRSTGSTGSGDVQVELVPQQVKDGRITFTFAANTHSVSLGQFDLKQIVTLSIGSNVVRPLSTPLMSGHHVSGPLVFELPKEGDTVTLTISGIPEVPQREYTWSLRELQANEV